VFLRVHKSNPTSEQVQRVQSNPETDDQNQSPDPQHEPEPVSALRPVQGSACTVPTLRHHRGWNESDCKNDARGDKDQVVQVAEDGDEVRDEIDRAERVGSDACRQSLGVPRSAWIASGEKQRVGIALQVPGTLAPRRKPLVRR